MQLMRHVTLRERAPSELFVERSRAFSIVAQPPFPI